MTKRQTLYGGVNDSINVPPEGYDALNRPTIWENSWAGDVIFARSRYQYDNVGREVASWRDEQSSKGERFYYSVGNQLTNVRYNADNVSTGSPANWDRWVDYGYTPDRLNLSYVNDNANFSWVGASALNQPTTVGNQTASYDPNFNLSDYSGLHGDYDAANQMLSASTPGNGASFVYDGLGRCLKSTVNGATYVITYDGWKPTVEWDGAGNMWAWNVYGPGADEILWRYEVDVGHVRFHHDIHGNVTWLLDWWGNFIEKYTYDAFGTPTVTDWWGNGRYDGSGRFSSWYGNRFMFQGREWIKELGIYNYRHRMYHPGLGRFLQVDPLGLQTEGAKLTAEQKALFSPGGVAPELFSSSEMNLFRYCHNDPINKTDPTGLYGQGFGWSKSGWEDFQKKQAAAIKDVSNRLGSMTKENFEKQFGKGSATPENMARKAGELRTMLNALKDDGTNGYYANAVTGAYMASLPGGSPEKNGVTFPSDRKSIYLNVEKGFSSHGIKHESAHNAGLRDMSNGIEPAYRGTRAFSELPTHYPDRALLNADTLADYAR